MARVRAAAAAPSPLLLLLLLLLLASAASTAAAYPLPQPDDKPLDCAVRGAAHALAVQRLGGPQTELHDALNLTAYCGAPPPAPAAAPAAAPLPLPLPLPLSASLFYVDALHGSDAAGGWVSAPFRSLPRGLAACRAAPPPCTLLLNASAPFVLSETLRLTAADSNLTIAAAPAGDGHAAPVVITGAYPITASWVPLDASAGVWRAEGARRAGAPLPLALLSAGRRLPRARWPNAPASGWETARVPDGYSNATAWGPPRVAAPAVLVPFPAAARPFDTFFPDWTWGRGGIAEGNFEPAEGFWIAPHPPAGVTWTVPSGFTYTPASWSPRAAAWDVSSAVVKVFHGEYWGSWVFELASIDAARGAVVFGRGGFQEARGMATGGALYVEHVRAELDAPGEWYAWANGTIDVFWGAEGVAADVGAPPPPPPPPGALSLAGLETLVDIEGTPTAPAADILFSGITFTGTQPTYLSRPFVAPSGGDWAFGDSAAVYVNGTLRVRFADCTFTALGGNALLLRGWNRNATVERSTFSRVGESAIVTAGRADLGNLSALDVPAGTAIVNCSFSDLGIDVKQAGGVYSALSANTTVAGCVFYSLPRAAININDGAHGGHTIVRNVFAATVLETADHASLNTWDRQPYVQVFEKEEGEKDTSTPRLTHIDQNFFINGGGWGIHPLDHDDGSNAFLDTRNVLFGAGFKNWEGFGRTWHGNLVIRPDYLARASPAPPLPPAATPEGVPLPHFYYFPACVRSLGQASWGARGDVSDGNTCILAQPVANIFGVCNRSQPAASGAVPRAANNSYLVLGGAVDLACGGHMSLAEAQAVGWELGSTVGEAAGLTPDDIVGMIHALLA